MQIQCAPDKIETHCENCLQTVLQLNLENDNQSSC